MTPPATTWAVGPNNLTFNIFSPGSGTVDLEDERSLHLVLWVLLIFTTDGHRNVSCDKTLHFLKIELQVLQALAPIVIPGSSSWRVRYSSHSSPFGVLSRPRRPCLLPSRLRARARSCWNQIKQDPPPRLLYRDTALSPLGPYHRLMPGVLRGSQERGHSL